MNPQKMNLIFFYQKLIWFFFFVSSVFFFCFQFFFSFGFIASLSRSRSDPIRVKCFRSEWIESKLEPERMWNESINQSIIFWFFFLFSTNKFFPMKSFSFLSSLRGKKFEAKIRKIFIKENYIACEKNCVCFVLYLCVCVSELISDAWQEHLLNWCERNLGWGGKKATNLSAHHRNQFSSSWM